MKKCEGAEEYTACNERKEGRKTKWIGQMLCRNRLLKHVIERKMEGRID